MGKTTDRKSSTSSPKKQIIRETEMYPPVKEYLEAQGYLVRGEVLNRDVCALKGDELVVVEMKRTFNATLLMQAVDRQSTADAVYIALPVTGSRRFPPSWAKMSALLKRLELGLILIRFLRSGPRLEIVFHPKPYERRNSRKKRSVIIREIRGRYGDYNTGGTAGGGTYTAYRENTIFIAWMLEQYGPQSPSQLRARGTGTKTQSILSKNYYGWFERVERGVYRLHQEGRRALEGYPELVRVFRQKNERP
jgi:hypothetical protein